MSPSDPPATEAAAPGPAELRREEQRVEERSAVFKKELGLTDLVLTQIVFVVGTIWVGTAAKLGTDQLFFWLLPRVPMAAIGAIPLLDTTFAVALGALVLDEPVGWQLLGGGVLVLSAAGLANLVKD